MRFDRDLESPTLIDRRSFDFISLRYNWSKRCVIIKLASDLCRPDHGAYVRDYVRAAPARAVRMPFVCYKLRKSTDRELEHARAMFARN